MSAREGLAFETAIESDCMPLHAPVAALLAAGIAVRCLRDCTRGGLASTLVEIAEATNLHIRIDERRLPVREEVRGACELLGLDPLYVANEGRFAAFIAPQDADRALALLQAQPGCESAAIIGHVSEADPGLVTMTSQIGASRIVDMLSGEQLPRIC
jgi:hydrogenase expression/formation protein HypE